MRQGILRPRGFALALCVLPFACGVALAQIAVSANDNKVAKVDGKVVTLDDAPLDNVMILDLGVSPPKIISQVVNVPASVISPPQSVAIAPDESIALIAAGSSVDPADPTKIIDDDRVSLLDLQSVPQIGIRRYRVGKGPAGLSFSPDGKLVLVANRAEGTISVLSVANKVLTPSSKIALGDAKSGPMHVAFTPDGKRALVTRDGDHRISILSVDGDKVADTKQFIAGGKRPYSLTISPKGDVAVVGNQGDGEGDAGSIDVLDLKANPPAIVDSIAVGQGPEGVTMSSDGSHVAVVVLNGSQRPKDHPAYSESSLIRIFRVDGTKLTQVAQAKVGGSGRGAVWSKDGRTILVQSMLAKELQVLSFDGKELKAESAIKVRGGPVGIRTAGN